MQNWENIHTRSRQTKLCEKDNQMNKQYVHSAAEVIPPVKNIGTTNVDIK